MQNKEFDDVVNQTMEETALLLKRKGLEYSSDADRLSAFKDIAKEAGVSSKQALLVLKSKHTGAIAKYIRNDAKGLQQILNEPIEQRIYDDINYLILLLGLLKEEQNMKPPLTEKEQKKFDFDALDAVRETLKNEPMYEKMNMFGPKFKPFKGEVKIPKDVPPGRKMSNPESD